VSLSDVSSRGNINFAGGDLTQYGAQLTPVDLELSMQAEPLGRLARDNEHVTEWLRRRRKYLMETLVPETKGPDMKSRDWFTGTISDAMNHNEALKVFGTRVDDHLEICRECVVDKAVANMFAAGANRVAFTVHNPTDETVESTTVTASFVVSDTIVIAFEPYPREMPDAPEWPNAMGELISKPVFSNITTTFHGPVTASGPEPIKISRSGDVIEIAYYIGDIGPYQSHRTLPVTIFPNLRDPDELEITLTAWAKNRRGIVTKSVLLEIEDAGWPLYAAVDPTYS
jgi:hypothetical protein